MLSTRRVKMSASSSTTASSELVLRLITTIFSKWRAPKTKSGGTCRFKLDFSFTNTRNCECCSSILTLEKFVSRDDYQLCEMDTDSLYMALSPGSLEEAVQPHLLKQFYQEYPRWLPAKSCDTHHEEFVSARARGKA